MELAILEKKHPEIKKITPTWERICVLVDELEEKYTQEPYFVSFPNETDTEKDRRKKNYVMGFYNPTKELITKSGDYIMRQQITRQTKQAGLLKFIDRADRSGQSLNDFIKNQVSPSLNAFGTVFAVVDKPRTPSVSKLDEYDFGMPYLCILHPLQVLDWAWGKDGELLWFKYWQFKSYDDSSPQNTPVEPEKEYVLWTRNTYQRFDKAGNEVPSVSFTHSYGVPVAIQAAFVIDSKRTLGQCTFFSGSRHILMGNALLSKANHETMKYGSLLLAHTSDWDPRNRERDIDPDTQLPRLTSQTDRSDILTTNDMANPPKYLEKDISVVDKANAQAMMYFNWAENQEATGQEAMSLSGANVAPQSGVAKAYDFQDVDANLHSKAMDLQAFEVQSLRIVAKELAEPDEVSVQYPDSFDVDSFEAKVAQVKSLEDISFGSLTGKKVAQKRLTQNLTQDKDVQKIINSELDAMVETVDPTGAPNAKLPSAGADVGATV